MRKNAQLTALLLSLLSFQSVAMGTDVSAGTREQIRLLEQKIATSLSQIAMNEKLAGRDLSQVNISMSEKAKDSAYLGLVLKVDPETNKFVIANVLSGSFGEKIGLKNGDELVSINGDAVTEKSFKKIISLLNEADNGSKIEIVVNRNKQMQLLTSSLEKLRIPGYELNTESMYAGHSSNTQHNVSALLSGMKFDKEAYKGKHFIPLHSLPECMSKECKKIYRQYLTHARATNDKYPLAKLRRAEFKLIGFGTQKDEKRALQLFKYLAKRNIPHGMYMVGYILKNTDESDQAIDYFQDAADTGHHLASLEVAKHHIVNSSLAKADGYLVKALQGESIESLDYLNKVLTMNPATLEKMPELTAYLNELHQQGLTSFEKMERHFIAKNELVPKVVALSKVEKEMKPRALTAYEIANMLQSARISNYSNRAFPIYER